MLRTVVVNLKNTQTTGSDVQAIRGVLWGTRGQWLIVRDAHALVPGREPVYLDGPEVLVPLANVDFIQVMP